MDPIIGMTSYGSVVLTILLIAAHISGAIHGLDWDPDGLDS